MNNIERVGLINQILSFDGSGEPSMLYRTRALKAQSAQRSNDNSFHEPTDGAIRVIQTASLHPSPVVMNPTISSLCALNYTNGPRI